MPSHVLSSENLLVSPQRSQTEETEAIPLGHCQGPKSRAAQPSSSQSSGEPDWKRFLTDQISLIHFMTFTDFVCTLIFTVLLSREMNSFVYGNELHRSVFYYVKRQRFLWVVSTSTVKLDRIKFAKH